MGVGVSFLEYETSFFTCLTLSLKQPAYLVAPTTNLPSKSSINGATMRTIGNATIQLLNQGVIHRFANLSTSIFVNLAKFISKNRYILLQSRSSIHNMEWSVKRNGVPRTLINSSFVLLAAFSKLNHYYLTYKTDGELQ